MNDASTSPDGSGTPVPANSSPPNPPNGYVRMPGMNSVYKYVTQPMVWFDAMKTCEMEDAHLAVPDDEMEAMALVYLMRWAHFPGRRNHMHVGVSDNEEEGVWRTVLGDLAETRAYVNWKMNQPATNNTEENCMQLYDDLTEVDYYCDRGKITFACEKDDQG